MHPYDYKRQVWLMRFQMSKSDWCQENIHKIRSQSIVLCTQMDSLRCSIVIIKSIIFINL